VWRLAESDAKRTTTLLAPEMAGVARGLKVRRKRTSVTYASYVKKTYRTTHRSQLRDRVPHV